MPDRYDPKLSVRPLGERKTADPSSDSDPLAELARIVSGRAPFDPPAGKSKAVPAPPAPEPDVERDLEAELLNDLQASFAAIREPLENAGAAISPPEPSPELPVLPPLPPLRAAEPPPRPPEPEPPPQRTAPLTFDISQAFEESEFAPPQKAKRPEPAKPPPPPLRGPAALPRGELPPRVPPAPQRAQPPAARSDYVPAMRGEPVQPRPERPVPPAAPPEKPSLLRRVVGPSRGDRANLPVRPVSPADIPRPAELPAPPRAGVTRPAPGRAEPPALPSRFAPPTPPPVAPPRRAAVPPPAPDVDPLTEDDFDLADLAGEAEGPFEDEFTLDDLDAAAYGPDDELPPFPEDELAGLKRRRSGRVFAVIAAMLAIVAVGGAAVFLFRGDSANGSPPPIIAADAGPTKVPPDEPAATDTDAQGKLIYDRVDESADGSDTRLVTSADGAVGDIPAEDADIANNPISRVIIPGGPGIDQPVSEEGGTAEAVIAEADVPEPPAAEQPEIGPRMVRTVVVKPDGTIVSSEATGVDEDGNALPPQEGTDVAAAPETIPDPTRTQMDAVLEGGDLPVNPDPLSQPEPTEEPAVVAEAPAAEPIPDPPQETETAASPDLPTPQPEPEPAAPAAAAPQPAPEPPPQRTIVATTGSPDGPIDLTPGTAPAAGAVQRSAGGGTLVQVSAQKSQEAAISAYRSLQQRYPNILGSFKPTIVRADLGAKGIYYRVRVGPFSGGDAARLCEDLKAAGADCILAR